jgi:hypothetical protein
MTKMIDITGSWYAKGGLGSSLQVYEPDVLEGESCVFHQEIHLSPGRFTLELLYDTWLDRRPGRSIADKFDFFDGLKIDNVVCPVTFTAAPENDHLFTASCIFDIPPDGGTTRLELAVCNTRPLQTIVCSGGDLTTGDNPALYAALPPLGEGGEMMLVHTIPFLLRKLDIRHDPAGFHGDHPFRNADRGGLVPWEDGMTLSCFGVQARAVHFLGMIPSIDIANGSWYAKKGDHGYSHFAGDRVGDLVLFWNGGGSTVVPLILGFNIWYDRPWDVIWHYVPYDEIGSELGWAPTNCDATLFNGKNEPRDTIQKSLRLVDGMRLMGSRSQNARFIFSLDLGGRSLERIQVRGAAEIYSYPVISAVTFETETPPQGLAVLPDLAAQPSQIQPVSLKEIEVRAYQAPVDTLMHTMYTFVEDIPRLEKPELPRGYIGPAYDFQGTQEAVRAATYLYYNGPECAAHIADSGTSCSSSTARSATFHYTLGAGFWRKERPLFDGLQDWFKRYQETSPGSLPGTGSAWARGIGELAREALAFGYDKFIDSYLDWLDGCLFADATPPHWIRVPGSGRGSEGFSKRRIGDVDETGNRENDGHGICMWGRYMVWHWLGRSAEWNQRRFAATQAAVEWIQWQLDTDTLFPGTRKDVLCTESECAHGGYDIYSSYNCLHGIKLSVRMAEQLGRVDLVEKWNKLYIRLRQGILDHLVDATEFGPVWHTDPLCDWQDHAHKLVHIQLATEGDTFTPLQDYARGDDTDRRYLEISRNTYRFLMREKNYNCLRMYGYGQGMMTQAALLMDEMADAEGFINSLVDHCYLIHMEGWLGPEGIILHRSGKYYLPVNGYMGQDSHVADSTKALRLMLGVDDNDPDHLRLVPRFPSSWEKASISDWPVLIGSSRQRLAYTFSRSPNEIAFQYQLDRPFNKLSVRLGPIPISARVISANFNGCSIPFEVLVSGDSQWVWIHEVDEKSGLLSVSI